MCIFQQGRTRKTVAASGFFAVLAACASPLPANAASSAWHREEGGNVRLVSAGAPDAAGRLRAALEIALQPGWKTYWRDPGTAGVPPSIDVSGSTNVSAAVLDFPPPQRHDDGYGPWAGYSAPVALPVTFTVPDPAKPVRIEASVFLGICRDICVPVSARLSLVPGEADGEAGIVEAAFAALPRAASERWGVEPEAVRPDGSLVLAARLPDGAQATPELFVASENGFVFGVPAGERSATGWRFAVPVLDRPVGKERPPVFYTLVAGKDSVSGTFVLP